MSGFNTRVGARFPVHYQRVGKYVPTTAVQSLPWR